jgi:hypothetical protein
VWKYPWVPDLLKLDDGRGRSEGSAAHSNYESATLGGDRSPQGRCGSGRGSLDRNLNSSTIKVNKIGVIGRMYCIEPLGSLYRHDLGDKEPTDTYNSLWDTISKLLNTPSVPIYNSFDFFSEFDCLVLFKNLCEKNLKIQSYTQSILYAKWYHSKN